MRFFGGMRLLRDCDGVATIPYPRDFAYRRFISLRRDHVTLAAPLSPRCRLAYAGEIMVLVFF